MEEEQDSETCIIHCTDDSTPLVSIKDLQSWETIVNAGRIWKDLQILKIADQVGDNVLSNIKYHRKYRQISTMKSSLEKIMREDERSEQKLKGENSDDRKSRKSLRGQSETSTSSHILPKVCIFCENVSKYINKGKTIEKLVESIDERANDTVKAAALQRCDQRMLSITSNELHASKAMCHMSCYKNYTQILNQQTSEEASDECSSYYLALNNVKNYVVKLLETPRAIKFKEVLAQLQLEMENFRADETSIKTAKHNLKRTLERSIEGLCFVNDDSGKLIMFPNNLDLKTVVLENQALKNEISELKSCSENVKMIANVAGIIRNLKYQR